MWRIFRPKQGIYSLTLETCEMISMFPNLDPYLCILISNLSSSFSDL